MNPVTQELWNSASAVQMIAMTELDRRGFMFLSHFGTENAIQRLEAMDKAFAEGRLYEHLKDDLGMIKI